MIPVSGVLKIVVSLAAVVTLTGMAGMEDAQRSGEKAAFRVLRIAHAGGGLGKRTYTNSYQALDSNMNKGFRYFELDFSFTADDQLVCLHDWGNNFRRSFNYEAEQIPSLEEFTRLAGENRKFTNCTLGGLAAWMQDNPLAFIVTDVKEDNIKALRKIRDVLPDAPVRVIPQIYDPDNFNEVRTLGFEQVIWTLYRYQGSNRDVLERVRKWDGPIAVTMPKDRAETALPKSLMAHGIPSYVHTVNSVPEMEAYLNVFAVTEIYTDFLIP